MKHWPVYAVFFASCISQSTWAQTSEAMPVNDVVAAVRAAVTRHPSIKSQQASISAARYDVDAAKAGRLPSISVSRQTQDRNGGASAGGVIAVQQPLWAGGRIDGAIDLASRRQDTSESSLKEVQRQLTEDTLVAYLNLQAARIRLQVADQNVAEHRRLLDMIERRAKGGVASSVDVSLAASRVTLAVTQREQIQGEVGKAQNDLQALTQMRIGEALPIPDTLFDLPAEARLLSLIEDSSPLLQRRRNEVEVARAESEVARAQLMPTVSLRLERDLSPSLPESATYSHSRGMVVFQASVEGGGFAGPNRLQAQAQRVNSALENVESARVDVMRRAQGFLTDRATYENVYATQDKVVAYSEDMIASFLRQFDAGRKSWLDVLNTQRELADARQARERTRSSLQEMSLRLGTMAGNYDSLAGVKP